MSTVDRRKRELGALMAQYQAGDSRAFESIYRLTAKPVARYVSRWPSGGQPDDLVQEVFLEVIRARRTYRCLPRFG